jgi:hypothetical protein
LFSSFDAWDYIKTKEVVNSSPAPLEDRPDFRYNDSRPSMNDRSVFRGRSR